MFPKAHNHRFPTLFVYTTTPFVASNSGRDGDYEGNWKKGELGTREKNKEADDLLFPNS